MWNTENGARQDCVGWEGAYLKGSTFWYLRHHASDWFDCRLKICCPPNWTAVADGDLVAEEHSTEWANYTWVNDAPMLRPALAAGNYSVASRTSGATNLLVYTFPQHSAIAAAYLDEAQNVMAFLEGILGPYGRKSFKIVETAHETMSGYACSGFVMLYTTAFSAGTVRHNLLAHEAGHEWFPYATGYQGWAYPWLWEAFPEYLSCLYEMQYHGVRARLDYDYSEYLKVYALADVRSIASSDWDTPYSSQILYAKGAWVLRMLHGLVGNANFTALLKDYVEGNLWGYGSAQAFLAAAAKRSPVKLDGFWEQWLNTTKALDVTLQAARQYENGTSFRLELWPANLLNGSNPADIRIEHADGSVQTIERGWDGKASSLVFEVPSGVKQVRLDPDGWLLDVDRSNQAAAPLQSGKLYELRPDAPAIPANITEGEEIAIMARIQNDGQYMARDVAVDFLVDGCRTDRKVLDIDARSWAEATTSWLPMSGRHDIKVSVDPQDALHEWDEQNNNASATADVGPRPPKMDVVLGGLHPADGLGEGMSYALNASVRNAGEVALGTVGVEFVLDGSSLGRRNLIGLAAGEERMVSLAWTARRGRHNLSVRADPDDAIAELDEGNNIASASFFVRWNDALVITSTPPNPRSLEPVDFSVEGDAEEFRFTWDDGTAGLTTPSRSVTHTFMASGRHNVRVEGMAGGWTVGEGAIEVVVANRPPELSAYFDPASPLSLSPVVFTARTLDLDGNVVAVRWFFGDGASGNGSRAEHSYAMPGNYTVRCLAVDNMRGENTTSLGITIRNRPPELGWNSIPPAFVGDMVVFTANATDRDGRLTLCRWQFGDGSSADGLNVSHVYSKPGNYLVTMTAYDELGASRNVTGSVEVRARKTAAPGPPSMAWLSLPLVLAAACAAAAWFLRSRQRMSKQRDDFFRPPPRSGQNP
jgi:PKD repeat protein